MSEFVARRWFEMAGLPFPVLPRRFARRLRPYGKGCFSTRPVDPASMYLFDRYPMEFLTTVVEEHASVNFGGHGANSYAVTFHLVIGRIVVILQRGCGG